MRTIVPPMTDKNEKHEKEKQSNLTVPKTEENSEEPKKKGRLRSISLTLRNTISRRESIIPKNDSTDSSNDKYDSLESESSSSTTPASTILRLNTQDLANVSLSDLADFMSSKVIPASPVEREESPVQPIIINEPIEEEEDDGSSIYSANSVSSIEDVTREKIV